MPPGGSRASRAALTTPPTFPATTLFSAAPLLRRLRRHPLRFLLLSSSTASCNPASRAASLADHYGITRPPLRRYALCRPLRPAAFIVLSVPAPCRSSLPSPPSSAPSPDASSAPSSAASCWSTSSSSAASSSAAAASSSSSSVPRSHEGNRQNGGRNAAETRQKRGRQCKGQKSDRTAVARRQNSGRTHAQRQNISGHGSSGCMGAFTARALIVRLKTQAKAAVDTYIAPQGARMDRGRRLV